MLARLLFILLATFAAVLPAHAHKASDAYLQLRSSTAGLDLRVDIALRDLDVALDIDTDADGKLTWGEIQAAWPAIERAVRAGVQVAGCDLAPIGRGLERRSDGAYAVLNLHSACVPRGEPAIRYTMLRTVDPTHRGIASIEPDGGAPLLRVLDPAHADAAVPEAAAEHADDRPLQADAGFVSEGVRHIVTGYDHVLFLLCLLLPAVMRRERGASGTKTSWTPVASLPQAVLPVIGIVTAFTVAHSITLGLAALKLVALPPWFIEPAIAVTIVLAAIDNLWPIFRGRRATITFAFGLIHGFGFAGVLSELNLPPGAFAWALLRFNVGLELGQLMIVLLAVGLLYALRMDRRYPRWVIQGGSAAAIVVGVLWFVERTADLSLLPF